LNRSESLTNLVTALAKAQAAMENPKFDSTNPHFRSKYCSLAAIRDAVLPALTTHGLALVQPVSRDGDSLTCETTLFHESGEFLTTSLTFLLPKMDAQTFGAIATYAKRIALTALLCVSGDADDDNSAAVQGEQAMAMQESVDTYTHDGLLERIEGIFADMRVPQAQQKAWWDTLREKHGDYVPTPVLRALYHRMRERQLTKGREGPHKPPPSSQTGDGAPETTQSFARDPEGTEPPPWPLDDEVPF
jgi:hypothetical protein